MAAGVLERGERDIFDTGLVGGVAGVAAHCRDLAEQPAEQVDIVDRVLDERAATCSFEAAAPGAAVVAPDGEELVVAQVGGEERPEPGSEINSLITVNTGE